MSRKALSSQTISSIGDEFSNNGFHRIRGCKPTFVGVLVALLQLLRLPRNNVWSRFVLSRGNSVIKGDGFRLRLHGATITALNIVVIESNTAKD
ncbi:hypothetical protein AAIH70_23645 [Neorhizobium sp. BT27B]